MRSRDRSYRSMLPFVGTFLCLTHSVPGKQRPRTAAPADLSRTLPMHVNHHACMCLASSFQRQLGSSRALSKVLAAASCSFHDRCGCFVMFPAAVAGLSVALEARRRPGGDDGGGKYGRHVGGLGGRSRRHKVGPAGTRGDSCHSLVAKLSSEKGCVLYTRSHDSVLVFTLEEPSKIRRNRAIAIAMRSLACSNRTNCRQWHLPLGLCMSRHRGALDRATENHREYIDLSPEKNKALRPRSYLTAGQTRMDSLSPLCVCRPASEFVSKK